jgi:hypothetical protein
MDHLRPGAIGAIPRRASPTKVERETGFEPATSTLARWHSTAELLPQTARLSLSCTFRQCQATHRRALSAKSGRARPKASAEAEYVGSDIAPRYGEDDLSSELERLDTPMLPDFAGGRMDASPGMCSEQTENRDVESAGPVRECGRLRICLMGGPTVRTSARYARRAQ